MKDVHIINIDQASKFERGDGVTTTLLVSTGRVPDTVFTSGLTQFPPGRKAPVHSHNCGEQVTVLEGECNVEVGGLTTRLANTTRFILLAGKPIDTTTLGKFRYLSCGFTVLTMSPVRLRKQVSPLSIFLPATLSRQVQNSKGETQ